MIKMLGPVRETTLVFLKGRSKGVEFIESPILIFGGSTVLVGCGSWRHATLV